MRDALPPSLLRAATRADLPALRALIDGSVRNLSRSFYTEAEIESGLRYVFGPDTALIDDGTYFVIEGQAPGSARTTAEMDGAAPEVDGATRAPRGPTTDAVGAPLVIAAAGGWSRRRTLYGGDQAKSGADPLLDPRTEPARIRAFFVDPRFARRGLARRLLAHCSALARAEGFTALELMATLPGLPLYLALGFEPLDELAPVLPDGVALRMVRMRQVFR